MNHLQMNSAADTIYYGGVIRTMTGPDHTIEAVAVKDGNILSCGSRESVMQFSGEKTRMVCLNGYTMIPGFYDAHSHFQEAGVGLLNYVYLRCPPFGTFRTVEECIIKLQEEIKTLPEGKTLIGAGYDNCGIAEKRHLNRHDLDRVSTERPVIVDNYTSHSIYLNSKALSMLGITRDTPDPDGGVIYRDEDGEPNGILGEMAVMQVWNSEYFGFLGTEEDKLLGIKAATELYASRGITTANQGQGSSGARELLEEALKCGYLGIRCIWWSSPEEAIYYAENNIKSSSNMITLHGAKAFQDGSIQCGTAYLTKPYYNLPDMGPEYRGMPIHSREELLSIVRPVHNAGVQMYIHCNGDAAIDDVLYVYEQCQKENPKPDIRHTAVHAQTAREDQLLKMKEVGIVPSFFVPCVYICGDVHREIFLGPERCLHYNPIRTAFDMGMKPTMHTDCPVLPPDPLTSIWASVTRKTYSGEILGPDEALTVYQALCANTINGAWQNHEECEKGTIEPGKLADFVILDRDPMAIEPDDIKKIKIMETIVGDKTVYANNITGKKA